MKIKRSILITIAVVLTSCAVIALASGIIDLPENETEKAKETLSDGIEVLSDGTESKAGISSFEIKDNFEIKDDFEIVQNEAVESFVSDFDMNNLTYENYLLVESYLNFIAKYNLSQQELYQINALVKNGTTVDTIAEIYKFYLTTNENFEIITQIAELEDEIWGRNWIENAFNKITENKHGVITASEAPEYLAEFETDEILYANILCRKGVYTIQEILDMHKNGTSWNEITDSVYSSVISTEKLDGSEAERNAVFAYLNDKKFNYDELPLEIYNIADLCARYKVNIGDGTICAENAAEVKEKVVNEIDDTYIPVVEKFKESVGMPESYMSGEEYSQYYEQYYSKALESGMSEREIEMLEFKGYSMKEIAENSQMAEGDMTSIIKNVKEQRGAETK